MHNNLKIKDNVVSFDCETTGLCPYGDIKRWGFEPARPFAFSFFDTDGNSAYFRLEVDPFTRRVIPNKAILKEVQSILVNPKIRKVGHNLGFDIRMSEFSKLLFNGPVEDTMNLAHVITGGDELSYGLKQLGVKYLEYSDDDEADLGSATLKARNKGKKLGWCLATDDSGVFGSKPWKSDMWMAPPEMLEKYAVGDAERTILFYLLWREDVRKDPNLERVYQREMKIFRLIREMEERGVRVFPDHLKVLRKDYEAYQKKWWKEVVANGGENLNFRSPPQMVKEFIEKRGHKAIKETDGGKPKVDGEFLKMIADKGDKLAKAVLEYNGAAHMIDSFIEPYETFQVEESPGVWVLHTNYRQCGPVTGRFSASEPNLMQVAAPDGGKKRTEVNLRPREAFGPRPGHYWYMPDYSQIEVWLFAYASGEQVMCDELMSGRDFHGSIAKQVWGEKSDYVEHASHYRKKGKLIMFCKVYGGGAQAVADLLGCSKDEAAGFIEEYDSKLPGIRVFMKRMVNKVEREGHFYHPLGRKFFFEPKWSYKSVNYLIQGLAADIMKEAMIAVDKVLKEKWPGANLLLTLHDELVIEVPQRWHSKKLMRDLVKAMQGDFHKLVNCPVPLPVSMKYTNSRWSKVKEIKL